MNKLKTSTEKAYKYKCEKLDCNSVEHKIVKGFYDKTTFISTIYLKPFSRTHGFNVYKIIKSNKAEILKEQQNNLMLFHGTNCKGVEGILTEGFKNSKEGWFGKGVYMTDCSSRARFYSTGKSKDCCDYMFVNEVFKSDSLQTIQHNNGIMGDHDFKSKHQFEKHTFEKSQQLTDKDFKKDSLGRKYRNVAVSLKGQYAEYLADESLVVPRYLIVIGPTPEFLNEFKVQEVDFELKRSKPFNLDLEQIKDEFTILYHEMIEKESWYVEYKHYENKLLETFFQQIDIKDLNPNHEHYKDFMMRLVIMMKLVKTHIK